MLRDPTVRLIRSLILGVALLLASNAWAAGPTFQCKSTIVNAETTGSPATVASNTLSCIQTGDWIIGITQFQGSSLSATVTCPTNFTSGGNSGIFNDSNFAQVQVCYKIATGSDTSSSTYTFSYSGVSSFPSQMILMMDYRGGSSSFDQGAGSQSGGCCSSGVNTAPSVTTTLANDVVVWVWGGATGPSVTYSSYPTGSTTRFAQASTDNDALTVADIAFASPGSVGAQSVTASAGGTRDAVTIAFGGSASASGFFYFP